MSANSFLNIAKFFSAPLREAREAENEALNVFIAISYDMPKEEAIRPIIDFS